MTKYNYGTLLKAQTDDIHPDSDIEKGDKIIKAGRLDGGMNYEVMDKNGNVKLVQFETVEVYRSDVQMDGGQIREFVKECVYEDRRMDVDINE